MELSGKGEATFCGELVLGSIVDLSHPPAAGDLVEAAIPSRDNVIRLVTPPPPRAQANEALVKLLRQVLADAEAGRITQAGAVVFFPGRGWAQAIITNDPQGMIGALDCARLSLQIPGMVSPWPTAGA